MSTGYAPWVLSTRLRVPLLTILTISLFVVLPIRERISLAQGPDFNDRFPVHERSNRSPPVVHPQIHDCAIRVWVDGIPEAVFEVFAKNPATGLDELVGRDSLVLGSGEIKQYVKLRDELPWHLKALLVVGYFVGNRIGELRPGCAPTRAGCRYSIAPCEQDGLRCSQSK